MEEAGRFTYPVRAKLAQYLIIFLLSPFSSSVASSAGNNHKISFPQWFARSPRGLTFDEPLSHFSFHCIPNSLPSHHTHCICRQWLAQGIMLSNGGGWTHTFAVCPVLFQPFACDCDFLGTKITSLPLYQSINCIFFIWKCNTAQNTKLEIQEVDLMKVKFLPISSL